MRYQNGDVIEWLLNTLQQGETDAGVEGWKEERYGDQARDRWSDRTSTSESLLRRYRTDGEKEVLRIKG